MRKIIAKTTINYMEKENKEVIKESTKKKEKQPLIKKIINIVGIVFTSIFLYYISII